jgi:hypothetical protein
VEIDKVIKSAIEEAVKDNEQNPELAKKIVAWVTAFASGGEEVNAGDAAARHLEVLYESVKISSEE